MGPLALFLVLSVAAYRITRLVVADDFPPVRRLRDRLVGPDERKLVGTRLEWLGELITCYWCASFWVSGAVVGLAEVAADVPLPLLFWWAVAGGAAFVSFLEDTLYGWAHVNMRRAQELERAERVR